MPQAQPSESHQQAPVTHETILQVPLQAAGIEERLQHLAHGVNQPTSLRLLPLSPAPSMASGTSLESHMTEISKTMLELAQAHERITNTQQQNQQTMVTVQQQQANAFEALAATTQQQKYDAMFAAIPRYDGTNKEECAVWLNQISSLATSGRMQSEIGATKQVRR